MSTAEVPAMSTSELEHHDGTPAVDDDHPITLGPHEHEHPKDSLYIVIALVLAALTGLEIMTYYVDFGALFLPTLLLLMSIKFWLVVQFFMHLKFDAPIFGRMFWAGLILAVVVYGGALAMFQVFSG